MTENVNSVLKPCLCGEVHDVLVDHPFYAIACPNTALFFGYYPSMEELINAWNTRPGEDTARQKQFEKDCKVIEMIPEEGFVNETPLDLYGEEILKECVLALRRAWEKRDA